MTTLFLDNQSVIMLMCGHMYHPCTKHINMCYHFIQWVVENHVVHLVYFPTADMVTDVLTKVFPSPKVKHFAECLRLCAV
jgi:hypothetical protein